MTESAGALALASARALLAARDRELAEADAELAGVVASAHACAAEAIRKLDAVGAEIDAAVAARTITAPSEGREFARFLIAKQHEISDILTVARADADAKVAVLQQLLSRYRAPSTSP